MPASKTALNSAEEPARAIVSSSQVSGSRRAAVRPQQDGRQGRAERQRVDGREDRRDGDRHGELAEELAGDAADEGARHEHGAEHQRHGDHRPGDFVHRLARGLARRQPLLQPALDVLDHHDRVVDHDADRQHQAEQRDVVQAEAEGGHDRERADDGHRHGDQRDERRPPVLQEDQHDDADQHDRLQQRPHHVVDRLADEGRGVVGDVVVDARRGSACFSSSILRLHAVGDVQRVGARKLVDRPGRPRAGRRRCTAWL